MSLTNLKGTETERNLGEAFSRELRTNFRYAYFAEVARQAGMDQAADIFEAVARNEAEHARHEFEFLDSIGNTADNIDQAVQGEAQEASRFYPQMADTAEKEGFAEIADFFRRMSRVEAKHEGNFRELLTSADKEVTAEGKTVGHSKVEMAEVMLPAQANPAGFVHGGELMKLMDNAAAVVAARHSHTNIVTASVENIEFFSPVRVGELVTVYGRLIFTSHSSMKVYIEVAAENMFDGHAGKKRKALEAHFFMVALDKNGKATRVPPLILNTEEEEALFQESQERYLEKKKIPLKAPAG
jgi:acyl-CoA hydrolase